MNMFLLLRVQHILFLSPPPLCTLTTSIFLHSNLVDRFNLNFFYLIVVSYDFLIFYGFDYDLPTQRPPWCDMCYWCESAIRIENGHVTSRLVV